MLSIYSTSVPNPAPCKGHMHDSMGTVQPGALSSIARQGLPTLPGGLRAVLAMLRGMALSLSAAPKGAGLQSHFSWQPNSKEDISYL